MKRTWTKLLLIAVCLGLFSSTALAAGLGAYTGNTGEVLKGDTVTVTEEKRGETVIYTLKNGNGVSAQVLNRGANTYSIIVPDRDGNMIDVVLDRADPAGERGPMGAIMGPSANRIGGAKFTLNGQTYEVEANNGNNIGGPRVNNLHGGSANLGNKYWAGQIVEYDNMPVVELSYDGDENDDPFPGDLHVKVRYALTDDNALICEYWGVSNADTIMNFTNHAYFNLAGHGSGDIFNHELWMDSSFYTPVFDDSIPTGEILSVTGTPMDFTTSRKVYGTANTPLPTKLTPGSTVSVRDALKSGFEQIDWFAGYDNNFVLNGRGYRKVATLYDPASGRAMDILSDTPGIQVFTANGTNSAAENNKDNLVYEPYCGIALETHHFPDAINKPWFPTPIVKTGTEYNSTTTFQFYVK